MPPLLQIDDEVDENEGGKIERMDEAEDEPDDLLELEAIYEELEHNEVIDELLLHDLIIVLEEDDELEQIDEMQQIPFVELVELVVQILYQELLCIMLDEVVVEHGILQEQIEHDDYDEVVHDDY